MKANALINESSPYLLQHAHNPVSWRPWSDDTLELAKKENKLLLVSIGYSACHWCHVMEKESFEDEQVARLMNEHFICVKVDREERPDVDQVYMNAVQLMTGRGGWPLNCFALPDGRPVYGGTYFPKDQWKNVLNSVAAVYRDEPEKAIEYAERLTDGIQKSELISMNPEPPLFSFDSLNKCVENWTKGVDNTEGGPNRAPKFPLPNNYLFLLRYAHLSAEGPLKQNISRHLDLTLRKMAYGGIYDQLGGGFARYSTDMLWKAPHFEKMLYDNAQLVSLYSEAYQAKKDPLYKQVVYETLEFIRREMTSPEGLFYSALDADSEGEEGKYYVWKKEELESELGKDFTLFAEYFNVSSLGLWEEGNYILLRKKGDKEIAALYKMEEEALSSKIRVMKEKLLSIRGKRIRPGLDNKVLTSWNAMMIRGYIDAYEAFAENKFLQTAVQAMNKLLKDVRRKDGGLDHTAGGVRPINGYLEDYAFSIDALIALYQATFEERWLEEARKLTDHVLLHFYDKVSGMLWFTSDLDRSLVARKMEVSDNVIPASNSVMACSLFLLGRYYDDKRFVEIPEKMLNNVQPYIAQYGPGYSNWGILMLQYASPFYEVAIVGNSVDEKRGELKKHYHPNRIFAGSKKESALPLLKERYVEGKTLIYVCENKSCKLPVSEAGEALKLIK